MREGARKELEVQPAGEAQCRCSVNAASCAIRSSSTPCTAALLAESGLVLLTMYANLHRQQQGERTALGVCCRKPPAGWAAGAKERLYSRGVLLRMLYIPQQVFTKSRGPHWQPGGKRRGYSRAHGFVPKAVVGTGQHAREAHVGNLGRELPGQQDILHEGGENSRVSRIFSAGHGQCHVTSPANSPARLERARPGSNLAQTGTPIEVGGNMCEPLSFLQPL